MSTLEQKLTRLTAAGRFDLCSPGEGIRLLSAAPVINYNRRAGGCGRMLKVLLHGTCAYDCAYCAVRLQREQLRFTPEELARTFLGLWQEGLVGGLFLSSGIAGDVDSVMHEIVETGEILRRQGYDGYLHLKILPGATRADIHDAARVADRISINLEATSADRLGCIAGVKDYRQDILKRQAWIAEEKPGGHTTQIVLGAAGETDAEIPHVSPTSIGGSAPPVSTSRRSMPCREPPSPHAPIPPYGGQDGGTRQTPCSGSMGLRPMNSGRSLMTGTISRTVIQRRSSQTAAVR